MTRKRDKLAWFRLRGVHMPLPSQPAGVAWPTLDWPAGSPPTSVGESVTSMLDHAFSPDSDETQGTTKAAVVVHQGRLVAERYADGVDADTTLPSWSLAKGVLHAVVGLLTRDGRLDIDTPELVPEWKDPADPRSDITLDILLRMSSGLEWLEDYEDESKSDVIRMLFGDGQGDMAAWVIDKPSIHPPDTEYNYSSGDSMVVSRLVRDALGGTRAATEQYLRAELFDPLGMASAASKSDPTGTWVGSSYCFATARDFARFGLLYLRDGVWEGEQLLPDGWVDYGRQLTHTCTTFDYGAHWQLIPSNKHGAFFVSGYQGQYLMIVPALDLVIVRLGESSIDQGANILWFLNRLIRLFAKA